MTAAYQDGQKVRLTRDDYKLATQAAPFTELGTMAEHAEIIARWADECVGGVMPWDIRREFGAVQS